LKIVKKYLSFIFEVCKKISFGSVILTRIILFHRKSLPEKEYE